MPADRRQLRRQLFEIASQQGGYFTTAQAISVGYSYQAQAHHAGAGNWVRSGRGLFRLGEWVPELHDELCRWTLWSKNRAVVSHETAMGVQGIGEFESARVHLSVPRNFTMRDDAVVLHLVDLPNEDIAVHGGFSTTTVMRTLIDIAAGAEVDQLAHSIQEAQQAGAITIRQLRSRAEAVDLKAALQIERSMKLIESP